MLTVEQNKLEERLMVVLGSERSQEHLQLKDQCLLGAYVWGEITFGLPNLHGWSYTLCTRATTTVIIDALVGAGPIL